MKVTLFARDHGTLGNCGFNHSKHGVLGLVFATQPFRSAFQRPSSLTILRGWRKNKDGKIRVKMALLRVLEALKEMIEFLFRVSSKPTVHRQCKIVQYGGWYERVSTGGIELVSWLKIRNKTKKLQVVSNFNSFGICFYRDAVQSGEEEYDIHDAQLNRKNGKSLGLSIVRRK